ncbi:type II toxin-antitoxin system mRNA interferase toxin, RelE/StbE family [Candidatus Uhrbacteria bacterium]|nr:type II toxin-antitoxin system mRNA interferase toxin, RelE/StbE family [Candidatus Uhrbacteria bacterium]
MDVSYTPSFIRMLKSLPDVLIDEALEKIALFRDPTNHKQLKVHKLGGRLKGRYSFSVNYKIRIVFNYLPTTPKQARLDAIGDHTVYE